MHLKNISHPVLIVGAWFDAQDFYGPFGMYRAMEEFNPKNATYLVMGPWLHGGYGRTDGDTLGNISFGSKTGVYYREKIELPFFNYYLKDKGQMNLPRVQAFETGKNVATGTPAIAGPRRPRRIWISTSMPNRNCLSRRHRTPRRHTTPG